MTPHQEAILRILADQPSPMDATTIAGMLPEALRPTSSSGRGSGTGTRLAAPLRVLQNQGLILWGHDGKRSTYTITARGRAAL